MDNRPARIVMIAHGLVLILSVTVMEYASLGPGISNESLLRFDAIHYKGIADDGYLNESSAFFPMMPLLWRSLGIDIMGMALVNALLYVCTATLLARVIDMSLKATLVFALLPSIFFLFTPYSEALFFCFSGLLLWAAHKRKYFLTCLALFACSMTRPAFTALLPAVMIMTLLERHPMFIRIMRVIGYLLASITALALVSLIQYWDTGDALGFYHAQSGYGNTFKLPDLPLTSWGGDAIVPLDGAALLLGIICGILLLSLIRKRIFGYPEAISPTLVISLGYVAGVSAMALFLRNGELYSLNRFVIATPFTLVLVHELSLRHFQWSSKRWAMALVVPSIFFLLFGSLVHIQTFLLFSFVALHLATGFYILTTPPPGSRTVACAWAFISYLLQLYFFNRYLGDQWVA